MRLPSVRLPSVPRARIGVAVVASLAAATAPLVLSTAAEAGAVAYGATLDRETALVRAAGGAQTTVLAITLTPDDDASAAERRRPTVVIPVPAAPVAEPLTGPAASVFAELDTATRPRTPKTEAALRDDDVPRPQAGPLADYAVTELPAGDHDALTAWLREHDLATPRPRRGSCGATPPRVGRSSDCDWTTR